MKTVAVVDLIKVRRRPHSHREPRLPDGDRSARPLQDAFRTSQHDLIGSTGMLLGLVQMAPTRLFSQTGLAPAGNVVDTNYTMVGKLPKAFPGGAQAYGGIHYRLRRAAQKYLTAP
ncbi:MAG: hypothetical protein ACOYX5_11870 [Actinomycetota bacterium]